MDDSIQTFQGLTDLKTIRVYQIINHLRVLQSFENIVFINNALNVNEAVTYPNITLDTIPHLALDMLRKMFISLIQSDKMRHVFITSTQPNDSSDAAHFYMDSCAQAEFGYYDLNAGVTGNPGIKLVKAWKVNFKWDYPYAFFQDGNDSLIYYFDGIEE